MISKIYAGLGVIVAFLLISCSVPLTTPDPVSLSPSSTLTPDSVISTVLPSASATPALTKIEIPETTILYTRDCGLFTYPEVPVLDSPEMLVLYKSVPNCDDLGNFLLSYSPVLAPNAKYLIVPGPYETWLADFDRNVLLKILSEKVAATWSPTSEAFTYVYQDTLYRQLVERESKPTEIFHQDGLMPLFARWSPDGKWIAALSLGAIDKNGQQSLTFWVVPTSGGTAIQLGTVSAPGIQLTPEAIRWSPDSQAIAYLSGLLLFLDGRQQQVNDLGQLHWWPPAQAQKFIGNPLATDWAFSHDSRRLAFTKINDDRLDIRQVEVSTGVQTTIGTIPESNSYKIEWNLNDTILIINAGNTIWEIPAFPDSVATPLIQDAMLVTLLPRIRNKP